MISRLYVYRTDNKNPYQNLAVEEYLTLHTEPEECILYLWQNQHTVVIGKNQNCWKECKVNYLEEDGGSLVRRLSGGGAVYHDLGNLNFTFCVQKENYDLSRQMDVVLEAVQSFGIDAQKTGRNDITVNGRKFSGNAFYKSGNFCYHHGTLLVSADKEKMSKYLNVSREKLKSKGVDSVRSRVANLREFEESLTIDGLSDALVKAFSKIYGIKAEKLPEQRLNQTEIAKKEKRFSSWEWKYGRNIPFQYQMEQRFSWGEAEIQIEAAQGRILRANVFSDGMEQELFGEIQEALEGCEYSERALTETLHRCLERTEENEMKRRIIEDICTMLREKM